MRILLVSDTHGRSDELIEAVKGQEFDRLFHLGDYVEDGEYIAQSLGLAATIVRGNGDLGSSYKDEEILEIKGKRIFMTHGHLYNIRQGLTSICYKALEEDLDLALFGHSHIPVNIREGKVIIMNPGSPSFPRLDPRNVIDGKKRRFTYGIISIEDEIATEIVEIED